MDWLEQELKTALSREQPPADFTNRVTRVTNRARQWQRWLAVAAAVVTIAGAGMGYRQHRGEVAKEQVMQAFKIAAVQVNRIQTHVREAGR